MDAFCTDISRHRDRPCDYNVPQVARGCLCFLDNLFEFLEHLRSHRDVGHDLDIELARDAFAWLNADGGDGADHEAALADMEQALLGSELGEMIVTPREIDSLVQDAAGVIASAVNRALQPSLSDAEIAAMMD